MNKKMVTVLAAVTGAILLVAASVGITLFVTNGNKDRDRNDETSERIEDTRDTSDDFTDDSSEGVSDGANGDANSGANGDVGDGASDDVSETELGQAVYTNPNADLTAEELAMIYLPELEYEYDPNITPVPELELSGNPEDVYDITTPSYVEGDGFVLFIEDGVTIYGNTPELIAEVLDLVEETSGLTYGHRQVLNYGWTNSPNDLFDGQEFAHVDPYHTALRIYLMRDDSYVACSFTDAIVINERDINIAAGDGMALVHEYLHALQHSNGVMLDRNLDEGFATYITGLICDTSTNIYFDFDAHYNYSNYDETITSENAEELYLAHPSDQWEHYLYGYRFVTFIYEEYGPDAYLNVLEAATAGENPNDEFNTWEFNYCMEAEDTVQYLEQVLGENVFEEFGDWMEVNNDRFEHPENYNWRSEDAATLPETTVETTLERS